MIKPKTFFDIYEETKPKEVVIEGKAKETLFEPEKPEAPQTKVELPEGFEEGLIKKITESILAQLQTKEGEEGNE